MKVTWRAMRTAFGAGLLIACASGVASAAPSRLARDEFGAAVAGSPGVIERFDGFAEGVYAPAIPIANGIYAAPGPWVYRVSPLNRALSDGSDLAGPRTFSAFPPGTRYWGADLGIDRRSALSVTVVGATETVTFEVSAGELDGFLGVVDPLGLRAVTIVNLGEWNLSFDNVTTAAGGVTERSASADLVSAMVASYSVVADDAIEAGADGVGIPGDDAQAVASAESDDDTVDAVPARDAGADGHDAQAGDESTISALEEASGSNAAAGSGITTTTAEETKSPATASGGVRHAARPTIRPTTAR